MTNARTITLADCPIGLFLAADGELCLKTEYGNNKGRIDAYIVSTGEFFWGGATSVPEQRRLTVTPVGLEGLTTIVDPMLHKREEVETSDASMPISRYRVVGGYLYHAHADDSRNGQFAALCFVPDIC